MRLRSSRAALAGCNARLRPRGACASVLQQRACADARARTLHAVSPLATLERGYAIVLDAAGDVVTDASR